MTKADIARAVCRRIGGLSKAEADELVDLLFETMKENLGRDENVKLFGSGRFWTQCLTAETSHNAWSSR